MIATTPQILELQEQQDTSFPKSTFSSEEGEAIWLSLSKSKSKYLSIKFPSPVTQHQWCLNPGNYVGAFPITPNCTTHIQPKVSIQSLFGMLEYVYQLKSFHLLDGQINCDRIEDLFERLAKLLAQRIRDRTRQGLYCEYLTQTSQLSYIRGRIDLPQSIRQPWNTRLNCHYDEQTADIADNQILLWTLHQLAHSHIFHRAVPDVRQAYRALKHTVSLIPQRSGDCIGRKYTRLNDDYRMLHALCRFFLEHTGSSHEHGDRTMLPFVVNMASLFEQFVAQWLSSHQSKILQPHHLELKTQKRVQISEELHFKIDLVLRDRQTQETRYVLDTKYKSPQKPSLADVSQVIAYAIATGCKDAVLVYPKQLDHPVDTLVQDVRVRSLTFNIAEGLEQAGRDFVTRLFDKT